MAIIRQRLDRVNPPRLSPATRAKLDAMTPEQIDAKAADLKSVRQLSPDAMRPCSIPRRRWQQRSGKR